MIDSAAHFRPADALGIARFNPSGWLANPHIQSIVPTLSFRRPLLNWRARDVLAVADTQIIDCGEGVRLLGHYSSQVAAGRPPAKDLAILLHGWEGSSDSMYVLSMASHLFGLGCDIFRLNFRDHGPTHHLNEDLFHSCRLDEVVGAVRRIQDQLPNKRISIAGVSLGGNFALRVAAKAPEAGIELAMAAAVCPVIHPHSTMEVLEKGWFVYQRYFVNKWKRSLRLKQKYFPKRYDFSEILEQNTIRSMTEMMVHYYSDFTGLDHYLNGYAIIGDVLKNLQVPSHVLIALDDPIIPAQDVQLMAASPNLNVISIPHGGHCGFMDSIGGPNWSDRQIARIMFGEGAGE